MEAIKDAAKDREALASLMIAHGFSTGHGDTILDLLLEFEPQIGELRQQLAQAEADARRYQEKLQEVFALANFELSEYHYQAMGCGLEDRNITDRYEAMYYGYHEAIDKVYDQILNPIIELGEAIAAESAGEKS